MAKLAELTADWDEWLAARPPEVQEMCRRLPPNLLYRMKSTGHRVTIVSYCEDGTVTVAVCGDFNLVAFNRRVFGISEDDLEECDFPGPNELVGVTADGGVPEPFGMKNCNN